MVYIPDLHWILPIVFAEIRQLIAYRQLPCHMLAVMVNHHHQHWDDEAMMTLVDDAEVDDDDLLMMFVTVLDESNGLWREKAC